MPASTATEVVWYYPSKQLNFLVDGNWLALENVPGDAVSVVLQAAFKKVPVAATYEGKTIQGIGVRVTP